MAQLKADGGSRRAKAKVAGSNLIDGQDTHKFVVVMHGAATDAALDDTHYKQQFGVEAKAKAKGG